MTVETICEKIVKSETDISNTLNSLSIMRRNIIEQLKPFINSQIKEMVEGEVINKSEHTKSLGREQLAQMKSRFNQILSDNDNMVEELFNNDKYWIYTKFEDLSKIDDYRKSIYEGEAWEMLKMGIKELFGRTGSLLNE